MPKHGKCTGIVQGKYPQAISNTGKAIELYKKTVSVYDTSYSRLLYLKALETDKVMYGTSHIEYASSCNNAGILYKEIGKYTQAEPLLLTAQKVFEKEYGKNSREYATILNNLALLYQAQGKLEIAEDFFMPICISGVLLYWLIDEK